MLTVLLLNVNTGGEWCAVNVGKDEAGQARLTDLQVLLKQALALDQLVILLPPLRFMGHLCFPHRRQGPLLSPGFHFAAGYNQRQGEENMKRENERGNERKRGENSE